MTRGCNDCTVGPAVSLFAQIRGTNLCKRQPRRWQSVGALRVRQGHQDMTAVLTTLLTLFVALVGPNGTAVYVEPSQVVAIVDSHGVGACPTTLTTVNQPVFVCESASEVKRKLEAIDFSDCLGRDGRGKKPD